MEINETTKEFFREYYPNLTQAQSIAINLISSMCDDKIEYIKTRIKSRESTVEKLEKLGFLPTVQSSMDNLTDLVGIRIVCNFFADVFEIAEKIENCNQIKHIISKDYINNPKESGYRSYHIIVSVMVNYIYVPVEIQIRTISQDSWACLEHQMKYKKNLQNADVITIELKRIADEMASTDMCMQTIRDLINEKNM